MAEILLQYIPNINSEKNSLAEEQLKMQKKVRYIYEIFTGNTIEEKYNHSQANQNPDNR